MDRVSLAILLSLLSAGLVSSTGFDRWTLSGDEPTPRRLGGSAPESPLQNDSHSLNVRDFGATGDGTTNDTEAFLKAFAQCSTLNYSSVLVPWPGKYVIWPMDVGSTGCDNVTLVIHGVVMAPEEAGDEFWSIGYLLRFGDMNNVTINGGLEGSINGNAAEWVRSGGPSRVRMRSKGHLPTSRYVLEKQLPSLIRLDNTGLDMYIYNITITNAPGIHIFSESPRISVPLLDGVTIETRTDVKTIGLVNTNSSCMLTRSTVSVGGTSVLLSPGRHQQLRFGSIDTTVFNQGGGIVVAVESGGYFFRYSMYGNVFRSCEAGYRFEAVPGDVGNGTIDRVYVADSVMDNVSIPLVVNAIDQPGKN